MDRSIALFLAAMTSLAGVLNGAEFYVSPAGDDGNSGTRREPFATLERARDAARGIRGEPITVYLRGGTHYLKEPLVFRPSDSGTRDAPVTYTAFPGEKPMVSGGELLHLDWTPLENGVLRARVEEGFSTDQLFVDGRRQNMARYPDFDPGAQYFNGSAADCISRERAARWSDPRGGYFHAMHGSHWGDMHYLITGKDARGNVLYDGGWQNNRRSSPHAKHRFVENIFEELDAPGEWFLDRKKKLLFFYPPKGVDLALAKVEAVRLEQLFEFRGSKKEPLRFVVLRGLTLIHTARTFMKNREPLLRSDWTIWRGGAVFIRGGEDCRLEDLTIRQVGSNAVFVSDYNRRITIKGCEITQAGASSVSFVGSPRALRSPLFNYAQTNTFEEMDRTPGPRSGEYPAQCRVDDCLLTLNGRFEKQTAAVNICMAEGITISRSSIYDVPRAGINICDGAFGGHVIEHCDVFDTVKETGNHGSFNSWGRDRFWHPDRQKTEGWLAREPGMARWDARKTTIIRHNRWRCDLGWDIDLDDGSSNYHIHDNLCLSGGIKLREGYHRIVENNVLVNNTFHPHVWYRNCDTVFRRNIVFAPYAPAGMKTENYGRGIDQNFLHVEGDRTTPAEALQKTTHAGRRSLSGDALFVDEAACDYRVKAGSPALRVGFRNFPMDGFGVVSERLRRIARQPVLPGSLEEASIVNRGWGQSKVFSPHKKSLKTRFLGAIIRNVQTEGDRSAAGLDSIRGVLVERVDPDPPAARLGLRAEDVILAFQGPVKDVRELARQFGTLDVHKEVTLTVWRRQEKITLQGDL